MTHDPRDVEAARRSYNSGDSDKDFRSATALGEALILAAKYAREAAEARLGPGDLSPEELDEARYKEAQKCGYNADVSLAYYRQLVRTGWTPPKVEGVDPDLVAAFARHSYCMSKPHLSGYQLTFGFETLKEVHAAHDAIIAALKAGKEAANG